MQDEKRLLDLREAASVARLSTKRLRALISRPDGPPHFRYTPRGKIFFDAEKFWAWIGSLDGRPTRPRDIVSSLLAGLST